MNITPPRRVDIVRKYIYIKIYSFAPHLIRHSCEACNPVWSTHGTAYINTRKNNNNREGLIWKTNTKLYTSAYNIIMYNVVKVGSDRKKELFKIRTNYWSRTAALGSTVYRYYKMYGNIRTHYKRACETRGQWLRSREEN